MITEINVTLSPTICEEVIATLQYIKDHSKLDHLDYASSGHTGFASKTYVDTQIALVSTPIKKGNLVTSLYQDCLVEGQETTQNVVSQWWASTFGRKNESGVNGFAAFTCGTRNSNDGDSAFVTGISNVLTGNAWASIIGGSHNTVNGAYESLTVGEFNVLTSDATYAGMFGHHNEADGSGGLTFGRYNYNYTTNGFCGGEHNRTNIHNRAVLGKYNDSSEENGTRLFVVGNGYTTQELPLGISLKPNNDTPLFTFSTPLLVSDSLIVDIKFTSGPAADDRTRFKLEDDGGHASSFIRVNSNGTLGDSYSGVSISSLRADGYYRVTIQPSSFSSSLLNISKIQAAGNYSMATGYIRANPIPETVEHRQNAFEVYDDGHGEISRVNSNTKSITNKEYVDNSDSALRTLINSRGCEVVVTGAMISIPYSYISKYKVVIVYGYKENIASPNQFCFSFIPDQINSVTNLQFNVVAGPDNWTYRLRLNLGDNNYIYWFTDIDYSSSFNFIATKVVGVF